MKKLFSFFKPNPNDILSSCIKNDYVKKVDSASELKKIILNFMKKMNASNSNECLIIVEPKSMIKIKIFRDLDGLIKTQIY